MILCECCLIVDDQVEEEVVAYLPRVFRVDGRDSSRKGCNKLLGDKCRHCALLVSYAIAFWFLPFVFGRPGTNAPATPVRLQCGQWSPTIIGADFSSQLRRSWKISPSRSSPHCWSATRPTICCLVICPLRDHPLDEPSEYTLWSGFLLDERL